MFGAIAGRYDFLNHLLSFNTDRYWRWRTVRRVPPEGDEPILDLCTGTGDLALAYFRSSGGNVPIVAADFCREMLVYGVQKSRTAGAAARVHFVEADALALPFADGQFQIVSVAFGLRNLSNTDRGLREMTRVCRPGGRVAILEFSLPRRQPFRALYGWYFHRVLPRIGQMLARNRFDAYQYLPQSVAEFPEREALTQRMQQAGLVDLTYQSLTLGVATLYVGRKPTTPDSGGAKPADATAAGSPG
jgi:demethylmenaquinone methyltransferase/2-methoxy-6-polyprenyl-1,4-benzoquinol methylase